MADISTFHDAGTIVPSGHVGGVDISVFSSFNLGLNEVAAGTVQGGGIRDPIINGKAELNVDTSSLSAVYIFVLMMEIGGIAGFYMLLQLRAVFTSLAAGDNFDLKNSARIRKFAYVAIGEALECERGDILELEQEV